MVKDKPTPDGVFWMVWDASGFYLERDLFQKKAHAKHIAEIKKDRYGSKWRITKVKVTNP